MIIMASMFRLHVVVLMLLVAGLSNEDSYVTADTATAAATTANASPNNLRKRRRNISTTADDHILQQEQQRPNVLMIVADQMRFDMIRFVQDTLPQYNKDQDGKPILKISTPNLDRLLQSGAYFETAYTQCAVCAPARATLRTGTTIERHGVQHNDLTLDENLYFGVHDEDDPGTDQDDLEEQVFEEVGSGSPVERPQQHDQQQQQQQNSTSTLAHQFSFATRVNSQKTIDHILVQELGYVSEYFGKLHLPRAMSYAKLPEYLNPIINDDNSSTIIGRSSQRTYDLNRPIFQNNDYDYATDTFMFQFDSDGRKNSRYLEYHERVLNEISSTTFPVEGMQLDTFTKFPYIPAQLDSRYGQPTNTDLFTMNVTDSSMLGQDSVIGRFGEGGGSLSHNHTPSFFTADVAVKALKRLQLNEDDKPWFVTASFHAPHPPYVASWVFAEKYWNERDRLLIPVSLAGQDDPELPAAYRRMTGTDAYQDPAKIQEWTAIYYALVEEVDAKIGELLDSVDDLYNTLVIFTSDHGEMLGSHGRRSKNNFYEESGRVPLLLSWPAKIEANQTIKDPVSHIDIVSTILDFVDAQPGVDESDGKSLRRYMKMKTAPSSPVQNSNTLIGVAKRFEFSTTPPVGYGLITNPLTRVSVRVVVPTDEESLVPNSVYDEAFVVSEWDFRKPVATSPHSELDREIDDRPNFMVRKGEMKLLMSKLAQSTNPDILFDLDTDPFEMNNLLSTSSSPALESVASAEHLRCLLLGWMKRMDQHPATGETRYYSDPSSNYFQNRGDIVEIFERQAWPAPGLWTSHSPLKPLKFGQISKLDHEGGTRWIRHEWLYIGTRQDETVIIDQVQIVGTDAAFFMPQRPDLKVYGGALPLGEEWRQQGCEGVRITFMADVWAVRQNQIDASIVLTVRDRPQVSIPIILTDSAFVQ